MAPSLLLHEVDAAGARQFALRGAVSSPIRPFHLSDLGIDSDDFLSRLGPAFHELPFDPYDPALQAERHIRDRIPDVYSAHESDWLDHWNNLSDLQFTNPLAGPQFWTPFVSRQMQRQLSELRPYRRRSCFQYLAQRHPAQYKWTLQELGTPTPTFTQLVADARARITLHEMLTYADRWIGNEPAPEGTHQDGPRRFAPPPPGVYQDPDIHLLIGMVCQLISQNASVLVTTFRITLHEMLTYADRWIGNEPAPEGTHQDGSPFIVSALVIERHNVTGGTSSVFYTQTGNLALQPAFPI